jgi:hypothetical protein
MWRLKPSVVLAALWAAVAVRVVRRRLRADGVRAVVPPPPPLPASGSRGVAGVLHRLTPTCLERALVAQAWMAAHGEPRDVVIGVPEAGLAAAPAHAWIDGSATAASEGHLELYRLTPPAQRGSRLVNHER